MMSKTFAWMYQQMLNKNCTILIAAEFWVFVFICWILFMFLLERKYIWRLSSLEMVYFLYIVMYEF